MTLESALHEFGHFPCERPGRKEKSADLHSTRTPCLWEIDVRKHRADVGPRDVDDHPHDKRKAVQQKELVFVPAHNRTRRSKNGRPKA